MSYQNSVHFHENYVDVMYKSKIFIIYMAGMILYLIIK